MGPEPTPTTTVPHVVGQAQNAAQTVLTAANLTVGTVTEQYSASVATGTVISQSVPAGQVVDEDTLVNLVVSKGPEPKQDDDSDDDPPTPVTYVTVPDLSGMTQSQAQTALTQADLRLGSTTEAYSDQTVGTIISQIPMANSRVAENTAVRITLSKGPAPALVTVPDTTGLDASDAQDALVEQGLIVQIQLVADGAAAPGAIIAQSTQGEVAPGTTIILYVSAGPSLQTASLIDGGYWPLRIGNKWTFSVANGLLPLDDIDCGGSTECAMGNLPVLELEITDQYEANGYTVYVMDATIVADGLWFLGYSYYDYAAKLGQKSDYVTTPYSTDLADVELHWVQVNGAWYLVIDPNALDELPDTSSLVPANSLEEALATVSYGVASGTFLTAIENCLVIMEQGQEDLLPYMMGTWVDETTYVPGPLESYLETIQGGDTTQLFALLEAFAAEFGDYQGPNPILNSTVDTAAVIADYTPDVAAFILGAIDRIEQLNVELDPYWEQLNSSSPDPELALQFLQLIADQYQDFEDPDDILLTHTVQMLADIADGLCTLGAHSSTVTYEEQEALQAFLDAFEMAFYESVEANMPLTGETLPTPADLEQAIEDIRQEMLTFLATYPVGDNGALVQDTIPICEALVDGTANILIDIMDPDVHVVDLNRVKWFATQFDTLAQMFVLLNPGNVHATVLAIYADAALDIATDLAELQPFVDDLRTALNDYYDALVNYSVTGTEFADLGTTLDDLGVFFDTYGQQQSDVLAVVLGIGCTGYADCAWEVDTMIDSLQAMETRTNYGTLQTLVPTVQGMPYDDLSLTEFAFPGLTNCLANEYSISGATGSYWLPYGIYGEDKGPLYMTGLTLSGARIDYVTYTATDPY